MSQDYIVTGDTVTMGVHYCTTGSVFAGLRWVRKKVGGGHTLQQGVRCLECGRPHWSDVPIVEKGSEE